MHVTVHKRKEVEEKHRHLVKLLIVLVMSMACLNMYSNDQQGYCSAMGPRISFSNDFADAKQATPKITCYTEAPVSSDFEFSLPINHTEDLLSKAIKEKCNNNVPKTMTLRDELLVGDDDEEFPRLSKNLGWWRIDKLGSKRNHHHIVAKKAESGGLERIDEAKDDLIPI
ncbi:hypothetical protein DCAR_0624140 [Daucus carota subsp. sativus]|uniref:Uncharacterized protein n=1 Tax=Daucus carota subsp. sativus TaxID=79200 RepID=A0A164VND7_DAUCS|nr:PREDICTED: uncharacterized protein LOC108225798 [Daucus carota subsp. sativus]WOH04728.1 hypothetical protein DCAR_0624140 [Daucus carota subsp. sativus]